MPAPGRAGLPIYRPAMSRTAAGRMPWLLALCAVPEALPLVIGELFYDDLLSRLLA